MSLLHFATATFWLMVTGIFVVGCSDVAPSNTCTGSGPHPCTNGGGANSTSGGTQPMGGSTSTGGTAALGGTASLGGAVSTGGSASATGGTPTTGGAASATGGLRSATGGATSSSTGTTGAHTNPLSQSLIDQFVTAHNTARSGTLNPAPSPALPPVSWDYTLADSAYNYLSKCPGGNVSLAPHNANRTIDYAALGGTDYVGENIYATTGSTVTPAAAVNSWMSEASSYDYNTNNISAAGHYTQVVWRASVRIGCAVVNCTNYTYHNTVLCDYAPGGNNTSQKPY